MEHDLFLCKNSTTHYVLTLPRGSRSEQTWIYSIRGCFHKSFSLFLTKIKYFWITNTLTILYVNLEVYVLKRITIITKKSFFFFQNIMVMGPGTVFFLGCIGYIIYMRMNEDKNSYTAMNADGTLTRREKTSRWDWVGPFVRVKC